MNNRQLWFNSDNKELNKEDIKLNYILSFLNRIYALFKFDNLPQGLTKHDILKIVINKGFVAIPYQKFDDKYVACFCDFSGQYGYNYEPYKVIINNPYINLNKEMIIDEECCLIKCDSTKNGLFNTINKYATLLTEIDLSFNIGIINTRMTNTYVADNSNIKEAYDTYLKDIIKGQVPSVVVGKTFMDNLTNKSNANTISNIKDLIELRQYLLANFYHEIGINSNYNMKRESIGAEESGLNDDALKPLIYDIYDNIKEGIETFNTHEGTNIIFDFSDIFKESKEYDNI